MNSDSYNFRQVKKVFILEWGGGLKISRIFAGADAFG